jgi:MYXO-CTERM domain-containing protein
MRCSSIAASALLVAGALALSNEAGAQTPYVISHSGGTYTPITGGSTFMPQTYTVGSGFSPWDEGYTTIPMPFTFAFFGQNYATVYAYTNGFLSFFPPSPNGPSVLGPPVFVPDPANPIHGTIGVAWDDLTGETTGEIRAQTIGSAPTRIFVVQMQGLHEFFNPGGSNVAFQVRFHEEDSLLEIVYGTNNGIAGSSAVIEDEAGMEGFNLFASSLSCGVGCTCMPGSCGSLQWQPPGKTIAVALPNDPELSATIGVPPGAYPGAMFDAEISLSNLGLVDAGSYDYELFLSTSNTSIAGATSLGRYTQAAHVAATVIDVTRTVTMPAGTPVGTYYVAIQVDVDDTVLEVLETNNIAFSGAIATAPDLTGSVTVPAEAGPGEVMVANLEIDNQGAPVASPISVAFYLSTNTTLDGLDTNVHTELFTLPDGFTFMGPVTIMVPGTVLPSPPAYYLIAEIDDQNQVAEPDELDNVAVSGTMVNVDGADLEVTSFTGPDIGFRGLPYPVSMVVVNSGGATARDFTACVVLSDNLLISLVTDRVLLTTTLLTMAPDETRTLALQPVMPTDTATGTYYVAAVADCGETIPEAIEINNIGRRNEEILLRDVAPDFVPVEVATTSAAASGEQLPVSIRIANLGNAAGSTHFRLVVSDNPGASPSDPTIYDSMSPIALVPPSEMTASVWAQLPGNLGSGNYYVGVVVDPNGLVDEVYEDNNTTQVGPVLVVGADLAIVSPAPPPAIIGVSYVRRFSAIGGTSSYAWTIEWPSGAPAGLAFDGTLGELAGTPSPSDEGRHDFTVRVTSGNLSASRDYALIVSPPTIGLEVVSSRLPPALATESYEVQLVAVGGTPPYAWNLGSGNVPPGIAVAADGELGGEPQLVGAFTFEVEVRDVTGARATGVLALDVVDPSASVTITTADVPDGEVGSMYETSFAAAGGDPPYAWRLEGVIPGLSFGSNTALLTGTPTVAGDYGVIIEVRDGRGLIDRNAYVLSIVEEGALQITNGQSSESGLPPATLGVPYVDGVGEPVRLRAVKPGSELRGAVWALLDGKTPPGISLDPSGLLSGTPTQEGTFPFIVQVRDAAMDSARTSLVIVVSAPDEGPGPGGDGGGCGCSSAERGSSAPAPIALLAVAALALLLLRRRREVLLVAWLAVAAPAAAFAQAVPYTVFESVEPFQPLDAQAQMTPPLGDGTTFAIPIPFEFYFYGQAYNTVYANANGLVAVSNIGTGNHYPQSNMPSTLTPNGFIAGLWTDWCADAFSCFVAGNPGMGVFYRIDSTPGLGSITIEYRALTHYQDDLSQSNATFQITLHEGLSSMVEIHFGPITIGTDFFGAPIEIDGRTGIENAAGTDGMWLGPCQATPCDAAAGEALSNQKIRLIADAGEDMAAAGVQVPPVGYPGLPFSASVRVISRHMNPLGPFRFGAYLIPGTGTSTAGGRLVYESDPITLAGYESRVVSFDVEVPNDQAVGQYRLGVLVDHAGDVAETSEVNNFAFSVQSVRIADRAPDFRVVSIRPLDLDVRPGDTLDVAYTVQNFGNEPGRLELEAYLSANQAITISDVPFGARTGFDTLPRETVTATLTAQVPAAITTGAYYVGLVLDPALAVAELDESDNIGRSADRVVVSSTEVAILTEALPEAILGQGYSTRVRAAGGSGTFTFALASGRLPAGMLFAEDTGELTGIPLEVGTFTLEVEATSGSVSGSRALDLQVLDPTYPLVIGTRSLPDATLGSDYVVSLVAVGGVQPYTWRITEGSPPDGLGLAPDGTLFGSPSEAGFTNFGVEVRDNASTTASVALTLDVRSPGNLTIVTSELPEAELEQPYSHQLIAVGGVGTVTWRGVTVVPDGLTVTGDGILTGIPEIVGSYRFRVEATDARGTADTNELSLIVAETGRFSIVTGDLPIGEPNMEYRALIRAEGGSEPYTWELVRGEGFLPPGFVVEQSDGIAEGETANDLVVRGTLEREGVWSFTARVWDAKGRFDEQPFAIVSRTPAPVIVPEEDGGCGCSAAPRGGGGLWAFVLFTLVWVVRGRAGRELRRLLRRGVLAASLLFATNVEAAYISASYPTPYQPLAGGEQTFFDDDEGEILVALPFPFVYFGTTFNGITVGINGAAILANTCTTDADCGNSTGTCMGNLCAYDVDYTSVAVPDAAQPNQILAPYWEDLQLSASAPASMIRSQVAGTAPNRRFTIEWSNVAHYDFFGPSLSRMSFQLTLDESGAIRFHYGTFDSDVDDAIWAFGMIGIEDPAGNVGVGPLACSATTLCTFMDLVGLENTIIEFFDATGPELVGSAVAPTGGDVGSPITVDVTAHNLGIAATGPFEAQVYFSTDANVDPSDTLLGTVLFADLGPGAMATMTVNGTVPMVPPGYYTIGAILDSQNAVVEAVEGNNTVLATIEFLVGSDLAVTVATLPASGPNEAIQASVTIVNNGGPQAAVGVAVYLSNDTTFDAADYFVGTATVAVPAQPATPVLVDGVVPGTIIPGDYFAVAVVDFTNAIVEADEANNEGFSPGQSEVRGADVVAQSVDTPGNFVFRGDQLQVTARITNEGGASTPPFSYSFHLSENELINVLSDPLLGEIGPVVLQPGQTIDVMHTVSVDPMLPAGMYFLGLVADSQSSVPEELEANNITRTMRRLEVRDPAADLTVMNVRIPPAGAAGESLVVARTLANVGNAPSPLSYTVVLSTNATFEPTDVAIGSGTLNLGAFDEDIGVDTVLIPSSTGPGIHYVGYLVDPANAVPELDETNNTGGSAATVSILPSEIGIQNRDLPIAVIGAEYQVLFSATGGTGSYAWSIAAGITPPGLALDAGGLFSGIATEEGIYDFTVAVNDGALTATRDFTLIVSTLTVPLEIVTRTLVPAFVGRPYRYPLTAFGGVPPYAWTVQGSFGASGLSMDGTGLISGTPAAPFVDTLTFRVEDATGAFAERPIAIRVVNADDTVRLSSSALPGGRLGEQYDSMLSVEPGTGSSPFVFALAGGALPPGLILELDRVYGVPEQAGIFTFGIRISDSRGDFDVNQYVVEILEADGIALLTNDLPRGTVGKPYVDDAAQPVQLRAVSGGATTGIVFRLIAAELPPGVSLAEDGLIQGTPTAAGVFPFTVLATDTRGQMEAAALGIHVVEPKLEPPPTTGDDGCGCTTSPEEGSIAWALLLVLGLALLRRVRTQAIGLGIGAVIALVPGPATAQVYLTETLMEPYVQRAGGVPIPFPDNDDDQATIALPFSFRFFGVDYADVTVGTNGYITFTTEGSERGNTLIPDPGIPNAMIALFWDDLITNSATTIVEGVAPDRVMIIQWESAEPWFAAGGGTIAMQVMLYEGLSGKFEVRYGPITNLLDPLAWEASAGYEDESGTSGMPILACNGSCDGSDFMAAVNTVFRATQDGGPDIVASRIAPPSLVYPGIGFDVAVDVRSLHQNPLGPFVYRVHLMALGEVDPNNPLFTSPELTLSPYQQRSDVVSVTVPIDTTSGRYRLALEADALDQVVEPSEVNNVALSPELRVADRQPDFRVPAISSADATGAPGGTIDVTALLSNAGNLDGGAEYRVVLSKNRVISVDDVTVATGTIALPLLTTATITRSIGLPSDLAVGAYYVGALIDPDNAVAEIDELNNDGASTAAVTIASTVVAIATPSLPSGYVGVSYSAFLSATGGDGTYVWTVDAGMLPPGLTLLSSGEITGTPTEAGSVALTLRATSAGAAATEDFTIDVTALDAGLTILTRELLPGIVGDGYPPAAAGTPIDRQQHIVAIGGAGPAVLTLTSAAPPGLTLSTDGYLSGIPSSAGDFDVVVEATDGSETVSRMLRLTIAEPGRLTLVSAILPDAELGTDYRYQLRVIGLAPTSTVTYSTMSTLPSGLALTQNGLIAGIPRAAGVTDFAIEVLEPSTQAKDTAGFRLVVRSDEGFGMTPANLAPGTVGTAYEAFVEAREGVPPFTWAVVGQRLPRGVMWEATTEDRSRLRFHGTPEEEALASVLVMLTDAEGRRAEQPMSLLVTVPEAPPPPPRDDGCGCTGIRRSTDGSILAWLLVVLVTRRRKS